MIPGYLAINIYYLLSLIIITVIVNNEKYTSFCIVKLMVIRIKPENTKTRFCSTKSIIMDNDILINLGIFQYGSKSKQFIPYRPERSCHIVSKLKHVDPVVPEIANKDLPVTVGGDAARG